MSDCYFLLLLFERYIITERNQRAGDSRVDILVGVDGYIRSIIKNNKRARTRTYSHAHGHLSYFAGGCAGILRDYRPRYMSNPVKLCRDRKPHPSEAVAPREIRLASPLHKVALRRGYFILKPAASSSIHLSVRARVAPRPSRRNPRRRRRADDQLEKLNYFLK